MIRFPWSITAYSGGSAIVTCFVIYKFLNNGFTDVYEWGIFYLVLGFVFISSAFVFGLLYYIIFRIVEPGSVTTSKGFLDLLTEADGVAGKAVIILILLFIWPYFFFGSIYMMIRELFYEPKAIMKAGAVRGKATRRQERKPSE